MRWTVYILSQHADITNILPELSDDPGDVSAD